MTRDEIRTAGLLFGEELALGLVEPEALRVPAVQRTVRGLPVPSAFSRRYQQRQLARGRLTYERHCVTPRMAARHAVLGDAAYGRPKLIVRVDAFPAVDAWDGRGTEQAAAFHAVLASAGVPYLMAVAPRVAERPGDPAGERAREHDPAEHDLLRELRRDGVAFGLHGLDRRTRSARRPTEFGGLKRKAIEARLDEAQAALRAEALHADVLVPPYDRFDGAAWPAFASRFDVVAAGPGCVGSMGFHLSPTWRGDAVWLPSYAPLAGPAAQVLPAVRALVEQQTSLWIPVLLDWQHEAADGFAALRALCAELAAGDLARTWEDFLLAVGASRQLAAVLEPDRL